MAIVNGRFSPKTDADVRVKSARELMHELVDRLDRVLDRIESTYDEVETRAR